MATKKYLDNDGLLYLWAKLKSYFVKQESGKGLSANDLTNELKTHYDSAYTFSQGTHAPTDAEKNIIVGIQKNGTDITIDSSSRKVNITVPTNNNQLTNGAGYQTFAEVESAIISKGYATTSYVTTAVANASHLKRVVVEGETLPNAASADTNTIYMLAIKDASGDNKFTEWMIINGSWEKIGSSDVNLSDYLKEEDFASITNSEIDELFAPKATT